MIKTGRVQPPDSRDPQTQVSPPEAVKLAAALKSGRISEDEYRRRIATGASPDPQVVGDAAR